jgi:hypothetical protein
MMRLFLLILLAIVVAGAGFFTYFWIQGGDVKGQALANTSITPASRPSAEADINQIIGATANAWMKIPDEQTGEIAQEFRATKYEPVKGTNLVNVTSPEARFYLGRAEPRQLLVINGTTGQVVLPGLSGKEKFKGGPQAAPSRGELRDVVIRLFNTSTDENPALVCTLPNAAFDNDTFRIYTEGYEYQGRQIAADQVPVQVRGVDYDFDGRGLEIFWNERDRRLQSLTITHGEKLIIKHPSAMQQKKTSTTNPVALTPSPAGIPEGEGGREGGAVRAWHDKGTLSPTLSLSTGRGSLVDALASADPQSAGEVVRSHPPARRRAADAPKPATAPVPGKVMIIRDRATPVYRATFFDQVRIVQADEQLASADVMHVDFLMNQNQDKGAATQPTEIPTPAPAPVPEPVPPAHHAASSHKAAEKKKPPAHPSPAAAAAPAPKLPTSKPTPRPRVVATTAPTSQPDEQPLTVFWTGKLVVTPLDTEAAEPPTSGNANITLLGAPAVLTRQGSRVECAAVHYRAGDGGFTLTSSAKLPVVTMRDVNGAVITTPAIEYDGSGQTAVLRGKSHADVPLPSDDPKAPPTMMHADWTHTCRLFMNGPNPQAMTIERAELDGDVNIDHPQVNGRSDSLELGFANETPTTQPTTRPSSTLRDVVATSRVHYILTDEQQKKTTIDCQRLAIATVESPEHKLYPRTIDATGGVHTYDDQQDLKAGELSIRLAPTTRPASTQPTTNPAKLDTSSFALESLLAQDNVVVTGKDGDTANSSQLVVETENGKRIVTLIGQPTATVKSKQSTLTGPVIKFEPDSDRASVAGAGTMHGVQQESANSRPRPVDISGTGNLSADGATNNVEISEHVLIQGKTEDGADNTATQDRVRLTLAPKPATQPAAEQADPATQPTIGFSRDDLAKSGFFKDKVIKTVTLENNVELKSVLNDAATGALLRRLHLNTQNLRYDMFEKTLVIPVPGQLLFE